MNQNQILILKYDKEFINKKLSDILSNNISSKYTCYRPEHNKLLIEELLNESDIEKRKIFENIFSATFLDCLKHIRGEINIKEFDGLDSLEKICEKFEDDNDYLKLFKYYALNFENIIMNKKNRKRNTKK
jgi:arginyl-tRNA--protein-N-Asp/Glu arginylyltransferase